MKKYLLAQNGNFYKANLHTHTTLSDGENTPEQVKKMYKEEGYSVLAYTDHNDFYNHNDLSDPDFLVLNGCEPGVDEPMVHPDRGRKVKTCHFCVIALDKNRTEGIDTQGRTFEYNTKDIYDDMLVQNQPQLRRIHQSYRHRLQGQSREL